MDSALWNNINSNLIYKHLFGFLNEKILLGILKYNKKLQNKLNIGINNYKDYYNKIEIEIEIDNTSKDISENINFINIPKKDESYYHIFFNEKEFKKNYLTKDDNISKVKIIIDSNTKSLNNLFQTCSYINKISFIKFNRKDINDMSCMFDDCSSLKEINFNKFNTDNVTNMNYMFNKCTSLQELNLNNFNTKNVKEMNYMFYKCSSLKELNLNSFNTTNVTSMIYMFAKCKSLKEINLKSFNTSKVINMNYMFAECSSLKELNLNSFNTNKLKDTYHMFEECSSLNELQWNNLNKNKISNISGMFIKCSDNFIRKIKNKFKYLKPEAFAIPKFKK